MYIIYTINIKSALQELYIKHILIVGNVLRILTFNYVSQQILVE